MTGANALLPTLTCCYRHGRFVAGQVLEATEFYVRKVEEGQGSGPLLDTLDMLREGHSAQETLPILKA